VPELCAIYATGAGAGAVFFPPVSAAVAEVARQQHRRIAHLLAKRAVYISLSLSPSLPLPRACSLTLYI
jgi:hypothetical protein